MCACLTRRQLVLGQVFQCNQKRVRIDGIACTTVHYCSLLAPTPPTLPQRVTLTNTGARALQRRRRDRRKQDCGDGLRPGMPDHVLIAQRPALSEPSKMGLVTLCGQPELQAIAAGSLYRCVRQRLSCLQKRAKVAVVSIRGRCSDSTCRCRLLLCASDS